jgi:hypothetical protein
MVEDVEFITAPSDWFAAADLSNALRETMLICFQHGGYIAGGFGTQVARSEFGCGRHGMKLADALDHYLISHTSSGDIDLWFPNREQEQNFLNDAALLDIIARGKLTWKISNLAMQTRIAGYRVQVITGFFNPMVEQLRRFDIYNAMVGLDLDTITYPQHLRSLEEGKVLHVHSWQSEQTINRFVRWMEHRGYESVTPLVAEYLLPIVNGALELRRFHRINQVLPEEGGLNALQRMLILPQKRCAERSLMSILGHLTGERLLEMSTQLGSPVQYDWAMQEIRRRMPASIGAA